MKKLAFEFWTLFFQISGAWILSFYWLMMHPLGLLSGIKGKEPIDNQFYNKMQTPRYTLQLPIEIKGMEALVLG